MLFGFRAAQSRPARCHFLPPPPASFLLPRVTLSPPADWDYCGKAPPGALPPCDLSVPPQRRPKCVLPRCNPTVQKHLQPECSGPAYKPPCNPAMPQWAQPPCISGPTASPTPRPTRSPTPGVPTIFRPPTVLPPCDPTIPPWERPPCRIVLPPCDPSVPPSAQPPCTVPEPTSAPTASPTASLLWSTSTDGCGTDGCMECEGDCDSDAECASGLVCIQRTGFEFVRGCGSGGKSGENSNHIAGGCVSCGWSRWRGGGVRLLALP